MSRKKMHLKENVEFAREYLRKALGCGATLYLQESYGKDGPNGVPCQVRCFAARHDPDTNTTWIECVTHYTLQVCNEPLKDSKRLGGVWVHTRSGGGYSRAQSVADSVASAVFGYKSAEAKAMKWDTL